jgi:tellurite resistance protein
MNTPSVTAAETIPTSRLKYFPVAWFSMIMGLAGMTIAWARAEHILELDFSISPFLLFFTASLFLVLIVLYTLKAINYPSEVVAEFKHPVKLAFVPSFSIAMLLLSVALLNVAPQTSLWMWSVGSVLHLTATLYVLSSWIHHTKYEIAHLNPAWFIPVVGNMVVPIAGIQHAPADISWFFFSVGLFFWPVLTALIFNRLIFHGSLPDRFMPTLFIFIAPPAVGFIAWFNLNGGLDNFGRVLYFIALAFTLLLASQLRYFTRLKFFLSWWAYSFPLAAMTIATLLMSKVNGGVFYSSLAVVLLAVLSLVVAGLLIRTCMAVMRREICVEGH